MTTFAQLFGGSHNHNQIALTAEAWEERVERWAANLAAVEGLFAQQGKVVHADEIALFAFCQDQEYEILESAVRNGFEVFNAADDHVNTRPLETQYDVHYTFLRSPTGFFRIELMRLTDGFSPLHSHLAQQASLDGGEPFEVHLSWKEETLDDMDASEFTLMQLGGTVQQECVSTYGQFSYWKLEDQQRQFEIPDHLFVKPRVNVRDGN